MNNFKEYDITTLFPGSMRACSMRDAGALWSYSEFDESMGMYFSLLNGSWLLDSSIYGMIETICSSFLPASLTRMSLNSMLFLKQPCVKHFLF